MASYRRLKGVVLELQAQRSAPPRRPAADRAAQKRALVEELFQHLDENRDGHLSSSELAQVGALLGANGVGCVSHFGKERLAVPQRGER